MWGSCFWFCIPSASSRSSRSRRLLSRHNLVSHTTYTHNLHTHNLAHTQLAHTHTTCTHTHTTYSHTTCHTHNFTLCGTHNLNTHTQLTHTQLVYTQLVHTQLAHTHTTCSHTTYSHTTYAHTTCLHTTCTHTQLTHTRLGTLWHRQLCVAHTHLLTHNLLTHGSWHFAWHRGTYGTVLALAARLVTMATSTLHFCVAGVALRWHRIVTLCGRRGTWRHGSSLCVAGVALMALGWLWWRAWSQGALGRRGVLRGRRGTLWHLTFTLCGRRGTWWHGSSLCVAGVALMALGWLRWRAWFPGRAGTPRRFAWQAWHFVTSTFTLCGRRGTWWHGSSLCVAGVALMALWLWWQLGSQGASTLCVAGVALDDMDRHFAWQAWHGVALMALGWRWWRAWFPGRAGTPRRFAWQAWRFVTSTFTLCGRRGTCQHMDRHFAWQAWHLWHWVGSGGALGYHWVGSGGALGSTGGAWDAAAYIHTYIHSYIHTCIHTYMHACIHACTTYSYRSIRGCYCERAGAVWGDLMLLD